MHNNEVRSLVSRALREDLGSGDVTTGSIVPETMEVGGEIVRREPGIVAGLAVARLVFQHADERIVLTCLVADGAGVERVQTLAKIQGPAAGILSAERVALNFLQRMSGIATMTRQYVEAVRGTKAVILDTRKTAPRLRALDKLSVRLGGGQNHRFGLYDMVLIKDNHHPPHHVELCELDKKQATVGTGHGRPGQSGERSKSSIAPRGSPTDWWACGMLYRRP
jgi:nicotinate-nucleotide pyrophosphorylase (carboxylating)